jgi:hypothetical protein
MKRTIFPLAALSMSLVLVACQGRDPVADEANAVPEVPAVNNAVPPAPVNAADRTPGPIPVAIRGRWGMTPADCTSTRGDAKGLLEIGPDSLKFYESRAVPGTSIETEEDGISGNWNFTGEGQKWSKYVSFKLEGKVLTRNERNPVASYNYARC